MYIYLYLLIFPDLKAFKIGITEQIKSRVSKLERDWGKIDFKESYCLQVKSARVKHLESALIKLLQNKSMNFMQGVGKTEFFQLDGLPEAIKYIDIFRSSQEANVGVYVRDISEFVLREPAIPPTIQPAVRPKNSDAEKFLKLKAKIDRQTARLSQCEEQYKKIGRLILYLYRKKNHIPYEYEYIGGELYFRAELVEVDDDAVLRVLELFQFRDVHLKSHGSTFSMCNYLRKGNFVQYNIWVGCEVPNLHLQFLIKELQEMLKFLPVRSPAATSPLPRLDIRTMDLPFH